MNHFKPQKKKRRKVDKREETVPIPTIPASEIARSSREITGTPEHLGDRPKDCSVKSKTADRNSTKLKFSPEWRKENPWNKVVENKMVCSPSLEA